MAAVAKLLLLDHSLLTSLGTLLLMVLNIGQVERRGPVFKIQRRVLADRVVCVEYPREELRRPLSALALTLLLTVVLRAVDIDVAIKVVAGVVIIAITATLVLGLGFEIGRSGEIHAILEAQVQTDA